MKGLFLLRARPDRRRWDEVGPFFPGSSVYGAAFDTRAGRRRIWAAPSSMHWGAELAWSDDFGRSWSRPEKPLVRFPEDSGRHPQEHLADLARAARTSPTRCTAASSRRRSSSRRTPAQTWALERGPLEPSRTARSGSRAAADSASTRSSSTRAIPERLTVATLHRRRLPVRRRRQDLAGQEPRRPRRVPTRTRIPSSASASTRSRSTRPGPAASSSRTTGASTAPTTAATPGRTSPTASRRTSASAWARTPAIRTPRSSCRCTRTGSAARPTESCASTARATPAPPGRR